MKVKIFEVGPRDGLQNQSVLLNTNERINFIRLLVEAGHRNVEAGAFVSAEKVPQMAGSDKVFKVLSEKFSEEACHFWALVPNKKGFEAAEHSGAKNVAIFTAASETFNKRNTNASIDESLKRFSEFVFLAKRKKLGLRGYVSTCFSCPFEGKINPKAVISVVEKLLDMGVSEISIGDTIGVATPLDVKRLIKTLERVAPLKKFALHFHDTRGTALANVLAGLDAGIRTFDSSSGGLGGCPYAPGAAGNVATDDLVYMLEGMGVDTGINLEKQLVASKFIAKSLNRRLPSRVLEAGLPKIFP